MVPMDIVNIYENYNEQEKEAKNKFWLPKERVTTAKPCYNTYFSADLKAIFEHCSKIASQSGFKLYLIGGIVRDMLLNKQSLDIDITIEGNAIEFAKILKKKIGVKILSIHKDFGTVKIELLGQKIDLASTRSESYPKKGHLPHVDEIGCSLEKDVLRRDFTINSLAMSLNQDNFADLIDYTGGFKDLKNKKIKILHEKSFIDDPTRIIRALKYSTRLGFELDKKTLKQQEEYLKNINYDMCYKRVKQEIKKTFEQNSQVAFDRFVEQGIYKLITPHPNPTPSRGEGILQNPCKIENLINIYPPKYPWLVYFGIIAQHIEINFNLTKYEKEVIEGAKSLLNKSFKDDFNLYKAFCAQKLETLLILAVLGKEKEVLHYLNDLRKIKLHINGNDLIKLGFTPSKKFSEIFDYVLKEKLKNPAMKKDDELKLASSKLNISVS